ncbi:hypothetical protein, partial [Burkholderia pseudomallei]|uniref:hypothetical protein n=1 Tax=Burkholderia pseudomallei TaxID=28450 RepID=UPI004032BE57
MLRHPTVASKSFLIRIGDRTVGGTSVRDQIVGLGQEPVDDCAVTALDDAGLAGEAVTTAGRTPLAVTEPPAWSPMAGGLGRIR